MASRQFNGKKPVIDRKLVLFDFDGTLFDSQTHFDQALIEFSNLKSLPFDIKKVSVGYVDPLKYDLGWGVSLSEQPALLDDYQKYLYKEFHDNGRFVPSSYDGIKDILDEVSQEYELGIVTARSRASTMDILKRYNFEKYFGSYRTLCCVREKNQQLKPSADALFCLLDEVKIAPGNTVMIGDTTSDILMANNAEVKSIAVLWGAHSREKLETAKPTLFVDKVMDLPQAVEKVFAND